MILTPMTIADAPTCNTPNRPARVVRSALEDLGGRPVPPQGRFVVIVSVSVDAQGDPVSASIVKTSGNAGIDSEALRLARQSTYAPQLVNCVTAPGTVRFLTVIDPGALGTRAPECATLNQEAVITQAPTIEWPSGGYQASPVTVLVQVVVDSSGNVADARIFRSSGKDTLDNTALDAARRTKFAPRIADCRPVTGKYILPETFNP